MEKNDLLDDFIVIKKKDIMPIYKRYGEIIGEKFYCIKCGKEFKTEYIFPAMRRDGKADAVDGYDVSDCICEKCAKQMKNEKFFDLSHPILRFERIGIREYKDYMLQKVGKRLTSNLKEKDLLALNSDAFDRLKNTEIYSTQDKIKAIRGFVCKRTMHKNI